MNTTHTTLTRNIAAADQFINWLVATARFEDLRWQDDESGTWVQRQPNDNIFDSAPEALADGWAELSWADQKFVIGSAADQLAEIETISAEAEALIRARI